MIEETLKTVLNSLVANRVYPLIAPDKPTVPYIIYQSIANTPENTLTSVSIYNTRMQIDCYDKTYAGVKALAVNVRSAMAAASFANVQTMDQDLFEDDVKLYRIQFDYSLWL